MSDELKEQVIGTQPIITPSVSTEPVATGEVKADGTVDLSPDPAALKAEIDRLKSVKEKAEEDARYWRKQKAEARAEYFKGRQEPPPLPPAEKRVDLGIGPEPKQEAFDDYQKYLDAKIAYEVNKAKTEWDREEAKKQTDSEHKTKMDTLVAKIQVGFSEYEDYGEVVYEPTAPITNKILEVLADGNYENPQRIAYYLSKNRAEGIRISNLNPIQMARELNRIEVEIAKAINQPPVVQKIPSAPPPIKPVGSSHTVIKGPDQMKSQKEYEEWASQNPKLRRF